mgnify:CR=1 FL=1
MEDSEVRKFRPNPKSKLMDQVKEVLRYHHYAIRTEDTYCAWILRFLKHFGGKTHPKDLSAKDVEEFLSFLATTEKVAVAGYSMGAYSRLVPSARTAAVAMTTSPPITSSAMPPQVPIRMKVSAPQR